MEEVEEQVKKILVIISLLLITGCSFNDRKELISSRLEMDLSNCTIASEKDTHGGFLGDGDYFAKIICTDKEDSEIKSEWNELPLTDELRDVMNLVQCDGKGCKDAYEKYNIPDIENGYYLFVDRHEEKDKKFDERASYNFSLGIYDGDNKIIYYYELDT